MEEREFLSMMQSDSKLWDIALTKRGPTPNSVIKIIDVPWGIGEVEVTLEGLGSVQGKRAAFSGFGDYIRGLVEEQISDEAITARAEQAAARAGEEPDRYTDSTGPTDGGPAPVASTEAVETFNVIGASAEDVSARIVDLGRSIQHAHDSIAGWQQEIEALTAYLEVLDAQGHKKTPRADS